MTPRADHSETLAPPGPAASAPLTSAEGHFWDQRYRAEGPIWGYDPSPTARALLPHLACPAHVLEVGFGYGRDVAYLIGHGCRVTGVELSSEGHRRAEQLLSAAGQLSARLLLGRFEDVPLPECGFDAVLCHRMAHLLISGAEVARFAGRLVGVLRPGGLLALGARNEHDLDPAAMTPVGDGVFEDIKRPGHRIRYWDDATFRAAFGAACQILALERTAEPESATRSSPCHLTVMLARRRDDRAAATPGGPPP